MFFSKLSDRDSLGYPNKYRSLVEMTPFGIPAGDNLAALLHFNGVNNSTDFIDEVGNTWTRSSTPVISTAQSVFGGASGKFTQGQYIQSVDSAIFELGANNFKIDCRIYITDWGQNISSTFYSAIVTKDTANNRSFQLQLNGTASSFTTLEFRGFSDNTTSTLITGSYNFNLNTWYYIEASRSGNNVYLFVDGVKINATTAFSRTMQNAGASLKIGAQDYDATYKSYFGGYIDEFHFQNGTAGNTANYTPPTKPYKIVG